jgi:hypothetical protein
MYKKISIVAFTVGIGAMQQSRMQSDLSTVRNLPSKPAICI